MTRGVGKYEEGSKSLFSNAMTAVEEELTNRMMVAQRSQLLQQAVTAFLVFGKPSFVQRLLNIPNFRDYLEEQGGSAAAVLGQAIVEAARIEGPDLVPGQLHVESVQLVWKEMMRAGAELAQASPSPDSTCVPTAPCCMKP